MGVSPMSLKKKRCSRHLSPMERRAGRRSNSLANLQATGLLRARQGAGAVLPWHLEASLGMGLCLRAQPIRGWSVALILPVPSLQKEGGEARRKQGQWHPRARRE